MAEARITVGIVGARGHTGVELIRMLAGHPRFELAFVSSRALAAVVAVHTGVSDCYQHLIGFGLGNRPRRRLQHFGPACAGDFDRRHQLWNGHACLVQSLRSHRAQSSACITSAWAICRW